MESNRVLPLYESNDYATFDLRKNTQSRILKAYLFCEADIRSAVDPAIFRKLAIGDAFIVKKQDACYVAVKLNNANPGGGNNAVIIGGRYPIKGIEHDFTIGSLLCGVSLWATVFPVPGKKFGKKERRALKDA